MEQVELRFDHASRASQTHTNLSAIRQSPHGIWVAGDETASFEHLAWTGDHFGDQRTFRLADYVDLPAGPDDEADIEGMARADGHLWVVGSHSLKRKRVKSKDPGKAAARLATVVREDNRYLLARLPLHGEEPQAGAALSGERGLAAHLRDDPHLGPFLALPGKDNGFDVEGIAVVGERVYLGLRGPVLRGWAVVLELRVEEAGRRRLRLRLREPYRKHFLDLGGLGVRDLCPDGESLLLLTGPTMALDGPVHVRRWWPGHRSGVVPAGELEVVAELPFGVGCDHPEGLARLADGRLMVVYDSPSPARITPAGGVLADVFTI
ncbi:DUF3616 domain-containing protein [Actinomadura sp. ATCC 31491]|uniref:DUF3616 domain-containing protein n=1 Tax=Actinomadura luzonensis TaxID=2805427 RepID=A0ABT0G138_9ACTN|nr:DUF3616 domain-containing protein [Actinomadura luzonensis]MCK2217816.1 DUF3616 domain-containing protein [Actinomadura luzonensis]